MEESWCPSFLAVLCIITSSTANLVTNDAIKANPGSVPSLECSYDGSRRWFVMQWRKIMQDNHTRTLLSLPDPHEDVPPKPEWADNVDQSFQERVRTTVQTEGDGVIFNMQIFDFQCSDIGVYICEIVTTHGTRRGKTHLMMEAPPLKPEINYDLLEVNLNHTFTLQCEGKVGIPPHNIRWYRKLPEEEAFRLIKSVYRPEIREGDDCIQNIVIRIDVSVNERSSGSVYRCAVDDKSIDQTYSHLYDNITVRLIVNELPGPVPPSYNNIPCGNGNKCDPHESKETEIKTAPVADTDGRDSATSVGSYFWLIVMVALFISQRAQ